MFIRFIFFILIFTFISVAFAGSDIILPSASSEQGGYYQPQVTPDGRYIVYLSNINDQSDGIDEIVFGVFLYDTQTKITKQISPQVNTAESQNIISTYPSISDDGRYIVYQSNAITQSYHHIYLYDQFLNKTTLVSKNKSSSNNNTYYYNTFAKISGNGQYIVYVNSDSNSRYPSIESLFLYQINTQQLSEVDTQDCHSEAGEIGFPDINYSGDTIVFIKASKLPNELASDQQYLNKSIADVCLYQSQAQKSTSIYLQNYIEPQLIGEIYNFSIFSSHPHISADGRYITLETYDAKVATGTDSVFGNVNLAAVYLYDIQSSNHQLVYQEQNKLNWFGYDSYSGETLKKKGMFSPFNGFSAYISSNNQFILFTGANPIDIADNNQQADTLLYNISDKTTKRVVFNDQGSSFNSIAVDIGLTDDNILSLAPSNTYYIPYDIVLTNNQQQNNFPLVSSQFIQKNETLEIEFPSAANAYAHYFAVQMPNLDIFLINQDDQLILYNGENLDQARHKPGKKIQFKIDDTASSGKYQLLSLSLSDNNQSAEDNAGLVKTQVSINEFNHFPIQTFINKCAAIIENNNGYLKEYNETYSHVLFGSIHAIHNADDTDETHDLFVCDTKTGITKLVTLDENNKQFSNYGYSYSVLSKNGEYVIFGMDSDMYVRSLSEFKTSKLDNGCYTNDQSINSDGASVFFTCFDLTDGRYKLYLQEIHSKKIIKINTVDSATEIFGSVYYMGVFQSKNLLGFSIRALDESKTDIFIYDFMTQQVEPVITTFSNVSAGNDNILPTTNNVNYILDISNNNQIILYSYSKKKNNSINPVEAYYAIYNRNSKQSQLLKIAGTQNYLKLTYTSTPSISSDGRYILFLSYEKQIGAKEKPLFGQPPYIYIYDRETEILEQVEVQGERYKKLRISDDGLSFRLGVSIYPLTRRALLSTSELSTGETLNIQFKDLPTGYKQYLAISNPQGQITLFSSTSQSQLFTGDNFIHWQGEDLSLKYAIDTNSPKGKYKVYLLTLPATISPQSNEHQWQLGVSVFEVN